MKIFIVLILLAGAYASYEISKRPPPSAGASSQQKLMDAYADSLTISRLAELRSATAVYYGDSEGVYPQDLAALAVGGKWLEKFMPTRTTHHPESKEVQTMTTEEFAAGQFTDQGGWYFVRTGRSTGIVGVNCVHANKDGKVWHSY